MRINIDGNSLISGVIVVGTIAVIGYLCHKESKKAKEEKEKLEKYKSAVLQNRDLDEEIETYSIKNSNIPVASNRVIANTILSDIKDKMDKAKTSKEFKDFLNSFDVAVRNLQNTDLMELDSYLMVYKHKYEEQQKKKEFEFKMKENAADRNTSKRNADAIADALKTLKKAQSMMNADLRLNFN